MRVLGIIPARGGSKGVPRKNIRLLAGKPLLQYTAEAALGAKSLSRVILSTDDQEIAEVGRACGLDIPFIRPAELAADETPTLPVVQHAVRWLEERGQHYDCVAILQPTSPMRTSSDIDACVRMLQEDHVDAVVSILPVPPEYNPHWVYHRDEAGCLHLSTGELVPVARRQDLPAAFHRDGSVYVTRRDVVIEKGSLYGTRMAGYVMDPNRHVNIDSPYDWQRAEALLLESLVLA